MSDDNAAENPPPPTTTKCVMLWVYNPADLATLIWTGCRLAATVKRFSDGTEQKTLCENTAKLESTDLPGWLVFWADDDGGEDSQMAALDRLGYRSAGTMRTDEICDVLIMADRPPGAATAAAAVERALNAAVAGDALNPVAAGVEKDSPAAAPGKEARSGQRAEEVTDEPAGCAPTGCVAFASEMCCGSCSIL